MAKCVLRSSLFGYVVSHNQLGVSLLKSQFVARDFNVDKRSILLAMFPQLRRLQSGGKRLHMLQKAERFLLRPNIEDCHAEKFLVRVAVSFHCGRIDLQKGKSLAVEDPHWKGTAVKQKAVLLLRFNQCILNMDP